MNIEFIHDHEVSSLKEYHEFEGNYIFRNGDQYYIVTEDVKKEPLAGFAITQDADDFYVYAAIGKRAIDTLVLPEDPNYDPNVVDDRSLDERLIIDDQSPNFLVMITNIRNVASRTDIHPKTNQGNSFVLLNTEVVKEPTLEYLEENTIEALKTALFRV